MHNDTDDHCHAAIAVLLILLGLGCLVLQVVY